MNKYNKTFIILSILLIGGIGIYMISKLRYVEALNVEEETTTTETTTTEDITSHIMDKLTTPTTTTTTTTTVCNTTKTTQRNNTTKSTTTNTTKTTTTTTTQKQVDTTTTTTIKTPSAVDRARTLASQTAEGANELLTYVNALRRENGLNELTIDNSLNVVAALRANEIADNNAFSHTRPNGSTPQTAMSEVGVSYRAFGENLAWASGRMGAQTAYNEWLKSGPHKENMLDADFTKMGASYIRASNGHTYWVQIFKG